MKRKLLAIAVGLLIGFGALAQDKPKLTESMGWAVKNSTINHNGLKCFSREAHCGYERDMKSILNNSWDMCDYTFNHTSEALKIDFRQRQVPNFGSVVLRFVDWYNDWDDTDPSIATDKFYKYTTGTGEYYNPIEITPHNNPDALTARGYTVDFSKPENAYISFEYKSATEVNLRFDLIDILGRMSNSETFLSNIKDVILKPSPSEFSYVQLSFAGDWLADFSIDAINHAIGKVQVYDEWSPQWWGVNAVFEERNMPLTMEAIAGFSIGFFSNVTGEVGKKASVEFKNFVLGKEKDAVVWSDYNCIWDPCVGIECCYEACMRSGSNSYNYCLCACSGDCTGLKTPNNTELPVVNGVVYSAGQIVVTSTTGRVVAVAQHEFNTNSLNSGVYIIKAAEGTVKIVK